MTSGAGDIIAVELDRKNGGADSWLALVRKHHNVCTLHAHDGDGHEYFLFANPNGMKAGTLARGLRVIDHTGISGFPDNLTIHGKPCSWWADSDAAKTPLVPTPDWLVRIPLIRTGRCNGRDPHQAPDLHPKEDIAVATYSARRSAHPVPFREISVIDVARVLLGEESRERSTATEKHFPDNGGLFVNVKKNSWYCHGKAVGGDALSLVRFARECNFSAGIAWLESNGFLTSPTGSHPRQHPTPSPGATQARSQRVCTYDYCSQDGTPVYQVDRHDNHQFYPWRVIGRERVFGISAGLYERQRPGAVWVRVRNGEPRPGYETKEFPAVTPLPYRLPELLQSGGAPVLIPGGEKDTDNLRALGFTASTNHGGEGHWWPELSQWFKGRRVFLLCDNDQQGEKHQAAVGAALAGIASELRLVRFLELPTHHDVSDFIERRRKDGLDDQSIKKELTQRFKEAPAWEAPTASADDDCPEPDLSILSLVPGAQEKKPSHAEILELLVAMDDVEYDRCRRAKAREWGLRLETLDRIRKHAKLRREYAEKQDSQPDLNDLESRLRPILETEGIFDLWLQSWDRVMAGEHRNAKLLYLVATSRLFDNCMHVAIKGPSSGGKSEIRRQVLEFFPPEDIVTFTTMSEKALLYHEGDFCHKILSMAEANGFQEQELQDLLLRELMSEGKLTYPVVQKINGQLVTTIITKRGPVCFMVTTTKAALHPENETRMLSLEIDDSEEQTRRVLKKLAETTGKNMKPDDSIHYNWQDFQRLLRIVGPKNIAVPFADALADLIPPRATRLRRDFSQIIACIKSHALIHCYRRKNNEKGELVADLDLDYVPVAELMGHITAEGAGIAVSKEVLETIDAVRIATVKIPNDDGATAFEVSKLLKLDKSTALRRLRVAAEKGFVVNLEQHRGRPGIYRLTDQEVEAASLLPSADEIRAYQSSFSAMGRKSAQPCNHSQFPEEDEEDSGCTDGLRG